MHAGEDGGFPHWVMLPSPDHDYYRYARYNSFKIIFVTCILSDGQVRGGIGDLGALGTDAVP